MIKSAHSRKDRAEQRRALSALFCCPINGRKGEKLTAVIDRLSP